MADKKLLEESTIRRFMKLANIKSEETGLLSEGKMTPFDKKVSKSSKNSIKVNGRKPGKGMVRESEYAEEGMERPMYEEEEPMADAGEEDFSTEPEDFDAGDSDMEGGDTKTKVETAVETLKDALNDILDAVDSDKRVEDEDSGEEAEEDPMDDMDAMDAGGEDDAYADEEPALQEKKKPFAKNGKNPRHRNDQDEDDTLEESFELIDDDLVEKLLQRVTSRLVQEAKSAKGRYEGKGAGVKQGAPFNKKMPSSSKNSTAVNARKSTKSINK